MGLPSKDEAILSNKMSSLQKQIYKDVILRSKDEYKKSKNDTKKSSKIIRNTLMEMRKVTMVIHP